MTIKGIKKLMITFSILIIILIIVIVLVIRRQNRGTSYGDDLQFNKFEQQLNYEVNTNIEKVKNKNKYYTVKLLIDRYISYIQDLNSEDAQIQELTTQALLDILDEQYKEEFKVNSGNIKEKYSEFLDEESVTINDMYYIEKSASFNIFLVYGRLDVAQKDFKILIKTDSKKERFSVFPEEFIEKYKYSENMNPADYNISENLEENEYNKFKYNTVPDERVIVEYFNKLKKQLLLNPKVIYPLLEDEYKNTKFSSETEFVQYINKNIEDFSNIEIQSYKTNDFDDYKEYVCLDQFGNEYVFIENAIFDYKIKLDRYTIKDEEFKELFDSSKEQEKVLINIELWVQMLNRRDYKTAYQVLDETFRENNFGSEEVFENYMREHFPLHYKVEYENSEEENGIYTQDIILKDISDNDTSTVQATVIMQLKEDYNFVMSFSV